MPPLFAFITLSTFMACICYPTLFIAQNIISNPYLGQITLQPPIHMHLKKYLEQFSVKTKCRSILQEMMSTMDNAVTAWYNEVS